MQSESRQNSKTLPFFLFFVVLAVTGIATTANHLKDAAMGENGADPNLIKTGENSYIVKVSDNDIEIGDLTGSQSHTSQPHASQPQAATVSADNGSSPEVQSNPPQTIPYAKLPRWGGEVDITVAYASDEKLTPVEKDGKLVWEGETREIHYYPIKGDQPVPLASRPAADTAEKGPALFSATPTRFSLAGAPAQIFESARSYLTNFPTHLNFPKTANAQERPVTESDNLSQAGANDTDKFEIELILKEKPETNVFEFSLETEGLNFYYQPPLNEASPGKNCTETDCFNEEGTPVSHRPENIVGSYAVYYKSQEKLLKTFQEGEKYRAGKAFHIYRPLVKDASGKEIWGILSLDSENSKLTVTVPENFLQDAKYPVSVDPTIGYETPGETTGFIPSDVIAGSLYTAAEDGSATSMSVYCVKGVTTGVKGVLVNHTDLTIASNGVTDAGVTPSSIDWVHMNFGSSPSISTDTEYLVMGIIDVGNVQFKYDTGDTNQGHIDTTNNYDTPADLGSTNESTNKYSIYMTYDTAGTPTPTPTPTPAPTPTPEPDSEGGSVILEGGMVLEGGVIMGSESQQQLSQFAIDCNALDGWYWYVTNGRGACWSKTLADYVNWNVITEDYFNTDNPGSYTCDSDVTSLQERMAAASAGEWYKIVSNVNGTNITSGHNGQSGANVISALAISDCIDGTRDLCTGDGCLGANVSEVNVSLQSWVAATGYKSALPYCSNTTCDLSTNNDYRNACEQYSGNDLPLSCSDGLFYSNRKVCGDGDSNFVWSPYLADDSNIRIFGAANCSNLSSTNPNSDNPETRDARGFRVVVRP